MHFNMHFKMLLKNAFLRCILKVVERCILRCILAVVVERSQNKLLMRSLKDGIFRRFKEDIYSISNEFRPFAFYPTTFYAF